MTLKKIKNSLKKWLRKLVLSEGCHCDDTINPAPINDSWGKRPKNCS